MISSASILIVDDEASIRFSLEEMLARDGYQVVAVESGEAALEHIAAREFDLALIDLKLPGIKGMQVLAALRQRWPETVVIVLTAHASLETAVEALRQGAHDYLFKPCKTLDLRESVRRGLLNRRQRTQQRELLRQLEEHLANSLKDLRATIAEPAPSPHTFQISPPSPPKGGVKSRIPPSGGVGGPYLKSIAPSPQPPDEEPGRFLQHGGLIVDLARHLITLDGQLLELSPTEFDLLAYLVSQTPRVVPPQELVREVQGYQSEPWEASETVRYHVHRLRHKMKEATGRADIIRTVRGVGYSIIP